MQASQNCRKWPQPDQTRNNLFEFLLLWRKVPKGRWRVVGQQAERVAEHLRDGCLAKLRRTEVEAALCILQKAGAG